MNAPTLSGDAANSCFGNYVSSSVVTSPNNPSQTNVRNAQASSAKQTVRDYLEAMFEDVRKLNEDGKQFNPITFSTIMMFMGVLSNFSCLCKDKDRDKYVRFIHRWMPSGYHCYADDIYKVVRCGLVHSLSLATTQKQTHFFLSHNVEDSRHLSMYNGNGVILKAGILLHDIKDAMNKMFADPGTLSIMEHKFEELHQILALLLKDSSTT